MATARNSSTFRVRLRVCPEASERGAREGERAAGPVGAAVEQGTIGGVVGGVTGVLGVDQRPRFHGYVVEQHRPSYRYEGDVRVGAELPEARRDLLRRTPRIWSSRISLYGCQRSTCAG